MSELKTRKFYVVVEVTTGGARDTTWLPESIRSAVVDFSEGSSEMSELTNEERRSLKEQINDLLSDYGCDRDALHSPPEDSCECLACRVWHLVNEGG